MSSDLPDRLLDTSETHVDGESADSGSDAESIERFTIFSIGTHQLAMPVTDVDTVIKRPVDVTRVPRSPDAIEGVTDIRGQITTLIDPHVHFPDSGGPPSSASLLVLANPDQPAAVRVYEVEGVEAVPEDDIFHEDEFEPGEIEGTALEHPLVVGAIRIERRPYDDHVGSVTREQESPEQELGPETGLIDRTVDRSTDDDSEVVVGEFSLEEEEEPEGMTDPRDSSEAESVEVDVTPVIDVDRLLLASGQVDDEHRPVEVTTDD